MNTLSTIHTVLIAVVAGICIFCLSSCAASELPPIQGRINLAAGEKVLFAPKPSYPSTNKGNTDSMDLTDGKLSQRLDMWGDAAAVGWNYDGRANLALDLGERCNIDEIAMRFSVFYKDNVHVNLPGWVEAFVSEDGVHYVKVAERSRWNDPSFFKGKDSPVNNGTPGVYCWRFSGLKDVRGRYVGLRFSGGYRVVSDELYVFGQKSSAGEASSLGTQSGFTVAMPQPYFNKPELVIPSNITAPQPLGITTPDSKTIKGTLHLEFDLPEGLVWDAPLEDVEKVILSDGYTRYIWNKINPSSNRLLTRIYLRAPHQADGATGKLCYRYSFGDWKSPDIYIPYRVVNVPIIPAPKRLLTTAFGWWRIQDTASWPDALKTFKHVGLNAVSLSASSNAPLWMPEDHNDTLWHLLKTIREQGFKIFAADATYNTMVRKFKTEHPEGKDIYCQSGDGSVGTRFCPTYRGDYYQEELARFAAQIVSVHPDITVQDIELWPSNGPVDVKKCTRCQADFAASGLRDWDKWLQSKGQEMWIDAMTAAHQQLKEQGKDYQFMTGGYDFESGSAFQHVFNLDQLYPKYIQMANPSYYSSCYPIDFSTIIEQTRKNSQHVNVMPILTPGDAGPIPGDAFKWSILESYCNGARGVLFWSARSWDAEYLIAYSDAIRAITPVEDIIMDGQLIGDAAQVETPGHLSGMKNDNKMVLLVSDYQHAGNGTLQLKLQLKVPSQIRDLNSGQLLEKNLAAGNKSISVPLNGADARLLEISPL